MKCELDVLADPVTLHSAIEAVCANEPHHVRLLVEEGLKGFSDVVETLRTQLGHVEKMSKSVIK